MVLHAEMSFCYKEDELLIIRDQSTFSCNQTALKLLSISFYSKHSSIQIKTGRNLVLLLVNDRPCVS